MHTTREHRDCEDTLRIALENAIIELREARISAEPLRIIDGMESVAVALDAFLTHLRRGPGSEMTDCMRQIASGG